MFKISDIAKFIFGIPKFSGLIELVFNLDNFKRLKFSGFAKLNFGIPKYFRTHFANIPI